MGVLSSTNVLYFRIVILSCVSFFCFKDVDQILNNSYFMVLTQSMLLPALTISPMSAQLGVFGLLFALLAIHDLIPLLERNTKHFASLVPFRLMVFFCLTAASYLCENKYYIHNNAFFIYCFMEVWLNFVIFNSLREERNEEFKNIEKLKREQGEDELDENEDREEEEEEEEFLTSAQELELQARQEEAEEQAQRAE